jgi:hypothetical protein
MTNDPQDVVSGARDGPTALHIENLNQASIEGRRRQPESFDLDVEANHVRYINALLLARIFPSFDGEARRLEAALWHQPKGTMHKLVATGHKLFEDFDKRSAVLLDGFERRYVSQGEPKV